MADKLMTLLQTPYGITHKIESILNDSSSTNDDLDAASRICVVSILMAITRPKYRYNLDLYISLFNRVMSDIRFVDKLYTITKVRTMIDPYYSSVYI